MHALVLMLLLSDPQCPDLEDVRADPTALNKAKFKYCHHQEFDDAEKAAAEAQVQREAQEAEQAKCKADPAGCRQRTIDAAAEQLCFHRFVEHAALQHISEAKHDAKIAGIVDMEDLYTAQRVVVHQRTLQLYDKKRLQELGGKPHACSGTYDLGQLAAYADGD